ncbi:hypothetical protein Tco_1219401 [Tanacetum coccineum]
MRGGGRGSWVDEKCEKWLVGILRSVVAGGTVTGGVPKGRVFLEVWGARRCDRCPGPVCIEAGGRGLAGLRRVFCVELGRWEWGVRGTGGAGGLCWQALTGRGVVGRMEWGEEWVGMGEGRGVCGRGESVQDEVRRGGWGTRRVAGE